MISEKQLLANQRNALKSTGPQTLEGKARSAANSLKHGLLAKEVVITEGEGAEDQQAFDSVVADLIAQFQPVGVMEEMLVEKIATCYWRLRRAQQFEVGAIRGNLDTAKGDYYRNTGRSGEYNVDDEIRNLQEKYDSLRRDQIKYSELYAKGAGLEEIYENEIAWKRLYIQHEKLIIRRSQGSLSYSQYVRERLNEIPYSDDTIWQLHLKSIQDEVDKYQVKINQLEKQKYIDTVRLSATKLKNAMPLESDLNTLTRYETAIERQFYKALNQLERLQRQRAGDYVPAPVQVDVNITARKEEPEIIDITKLKIDRN